MCAVRDDASSREIATTIERSLGRPEHWRLAEEKSQLLASLGGSDIRCPRTILAESPRELDRICETLSFPLVLKRDRTFGGQGVLFCHGKNETRAAFERLAAAPTLRDTMRSVVYASDLGALNRYFNPPVPVIAAQAHVEGQPANRAVACCEGEVLAGVTVVAVETNPRPYGPAAVVRIVENAAIDESARIIARRLGLSGICGFDFVIEARTGDAYFIELNARATPTCHIGRARDSDVCGALARRWGAIGDVDDAVDSRDHSDPIPVFPAEWRRDPNSPHLGSPHHGVPWSNPAVVAAFALAQATQSDPARRTAVSNLLDRLARRRLVRRR